MPADTFPVYPPPEPPDRGFFAPIPADAVLTLAAARRLHSGDALLLVALFSYKNQATTIVFPRQQTVARKMGCSVDTVQRGLSRLISARLIVQTRLRDANGRWGPCLYDLAPSLARLSPQAAGARSGQWGSQSQSSLSPESENRPTPGVTIPHGGGILNEDSGDVVETNKGRGGTNPPAPSLKGRGAGLGSPEGSLSLPFGRAGVGTFLIAHGVHTPVADRLAARYGEPRCREALAALARQPGVRDKAAWLVACLTQGWHLGQSSAATDFAERPRAYRPYPVPLPPSAVPAAPKPPAFSIAPSRALQPESDPALEARARAQLLAEGHPLIVQQLRRGRGWSFLQARMAQLQRL